MNDSVTIGADRIQVINWVHMVLSTDFGDRDEVMHVNEISPNFTVLLFEIHLTCDTSESVMGKAIGSCLWITLILIHVNPCLSALGTLCGICNLVRM